MKLFSRLLILFAVVAFMGCKSEMKIDEAYAGDGDLKWYTNLEDAKKVAKQENKDILINFTGSDWCIWCKKLDAEVFSKKEFSDYAKASLILVKLDFPKRIPQTDEVKNYNRNLMNTYGVQGFPTIVLLDSKGTHVTDTGYQEGGAVAYVSHLKQLLK